MVTIESLVRMGLHSWLLKYSSDLESPTFYIYLDGNLVAETEQTEYSIAVNLDEASLIEILDDPDTAPMQVFPGKVRLGWFFVEGTDYYRVDEYIDGAWVERRRLSENNGYLMWESRFLEDGQTHIFRIVPIGTNGNEGDAKQFAVLMVRRPDVPDAGYGYNEGAGKVIIFDNDSPPNDLINHLSAHYKMNDNAANTTVIDSMKNSDGTAQQNTSILHTDGKVGGALTFNSTSDRIAIPNTPQIDITVAPLSIFAWIFPLTGAIQYEMVICKNLSSYANIQYALEWTAGQEFLTCYLEGQIRAYSDLGDNAIFVPAGQWSFVGFTWDGINVQIFVNGNPAGNAGTYIGSLTSRLYCNIGKAAGAVPNYFKGFIDGVGIVKKVLSQEDWNFLYNNGNGREDF